MPEEDNAVVFDDVEEASTASAGSEQRLPSGENAAMADQERPTAQELDDREARMSGPRKPMGPTENRPQADDAIEPTEPEEN